MPSNKWNLENKVAVITGASKGIGLACAIEFLELGAEVVVVARTEEVLKEAFAVHQESNRKIHLVAADVTEEKGRLKVFEAVKKIGRLDVLVNNVGTNIRKPLVEFTTQELNQILTTNLTSALEMTRDAHEWLLKGTDASVIFISSLTAFASAGTSTIYSATKAALNQATRS